VRFRDGHATLGGLAAIVLWSLTVGVARRIIEPLGPLTACAATYLAGGAIGCALLLSRARTRAGMARLPRRYLVGCGALFVGYTLCLYLAIGLAAGRNEVFVVGLINYLWPGLTLVLSLPVLGCRGRWSLPVGLLLALVGVALATWPARGAGFGAVVSDLGANAWAYALALMAAVAWAMYSNLARRWAGRSEGDAVALFVLAAGVLAATLSFWRGETANWSASVAAGVALMALGPALTAYLLWDRAVRRGNLTLVASAAYLTPLLSTAITSAALGALPGAGVWVGCVLVVVGAMVCKVSVRPEPRTGEGPRQQVGS